MLSKLNVLRAIQFYSLENHFFVHDFWNHVQDIKRKEKKKKKSREESKNLKSRKQIDDETFHQVLPMIVSTGVHVTWEWTVAHIK